MTTSTVPATNKMPQAAASVGSANCPCTPADTIKNPVVTVVTTFALVLFGAIALGILDTDEFPEVNPPVISVRIPYPGAAPETGFKGLGGLHRRNNLLKFGHKESENQSRFDFTRLDTRQTCSVTLIPAALPMLEPERGARMGQLLSPNVWETATGSDRDLT